MMDGQNPNNKKPVQINLSEIEKQFMIGLQRHFDMLSFNLASHALLQEDAYKKSVNEPRIMPYHRYHQNFEQMQAYARDLVARQVIHDSLNLTITAMNNAHFFLALLKVTDKNKRITPEAQKMAREAQQNFIKAQLDKKFDRLEKDYGIMCELEDSIISLGHVLQILLKQKNIVQRGQLNDQGKLVVELKSAGPVEGEVAPDLKPNELVDIRKIYYEEDVVYLSDVELQLVLVTIASFADSLFKSVTEYARSVQKDA